MPVISLPLLTRLQLRLQTGTDEQGNPILSTRTYSNLKPEAADDDVYATGQELAGLQVHPLQVVRRVDEFELMEE